MDDCISTTTITVDALQVIHGGTTDNVTDPLDNQVYMVPCGEGVGTTSASTTDITGSGLVEVYFDLVVVWVIIYVLFIWIARQFTL